MAYRADKGEKLLEIQTGLKGGMGPPITYMIDGKQYVSLMGGTGRIVPRDGSPAAPGAVLPPAPKLLTFVLDGKGRLPDTAGSK
jgi:quinohemoprotein ethanol dehydrogenase